MLYLLKGDHRVYGLEYSVANLGTPIMEHKTEKTRESDMDIGFT